MRRLIAAALITCIALTAPVTALAQDGGSNCLSPDERRKALKAIRAGQLDALDKLRTCQADRNETAGRLNELRAQYRREKQQTDQLTAKIGKLQDRNTTLRKRPKVWQVLAVSVGALLIGGAGGYLTAKLVP